MLRQASKVSGPELILNLKNVNINNFLEDKYRDTEHKGRWNT